MKTFTEGLLRYFSQEQLQQIQAVKIGIAGAGGLGSNCAHMLVRCGFIQFKIIDFDNVDYSNLNRQFYFTDQVGQPKVSMLYQNLMRINPDLKLEISTVRIDADNVEALFADCQVVVEAFDRPEYKKLIVEAYLKSDKLLVAASGLAGWGNSDDIKVRRVKDNFYVVGDLVSGIGPGCPPLSPRVTIAAAKQADIVLTHVLGGEKRDNSGA